MPRAGERVLTVRSFCRRRRHRARPRGETRRRHAGSQIVTLTQRHGDADRPRGGEDGMAAAPLPLLGSLSAPAVRVGLPSTNPVRLTGCEGTPYLGTLSSPMRGRDRRTYPQFVGTGSVGTSARGVALNKRGARPRPWRSRGPSRGVITSTTPPLGEIACSPWPRISRTPTSPTSGAGADNGSPPTPSIRSA